MYMHDFEYAANIPIDIIKKIDEIRCSEPIQEDVYRVSKYGLIDEVTFDNTFAEVLKGTTSRNKDFDDVSTYSTSFYLVPEPCYQRVSFLARRFKKKYPKPCVISGRIDATMGKYQRTIERIKNYDPDHVDMWIYDGREQRVIDSFKRHKG